MAHKLPKLICNHGIVKNEYVAINGDCIDVVRQIPDQSIGFCIYSPPFSNLYTYSDSECDMGNNADDAQFFEHYRFLIKDLLRIMQPGRLCAVHCSDIPFMKWKDGLIALNDLSAEISRAHTELGWVLHTKITIWKNPVVEMQRTHALGLLHQQLLKDSVRSRVGMPDYVYVFRAPGDNVEFVPQDRDQFPVELWQNWASPVWMDIRQTDTLNAKVARDARDEKHDAPLQLDLIGRAIQLWSNPGDIVFSPFMGVGSEGYKAVGMGRKFVGVELKKKYYETACKNLANAKAASIGFFS